MKTNPLLRWSVLVAVVLVIVAGAPTQISDLDPFSDASGTEQADGPTGVLARSAFRGNRYDGTRTKWRDRNGVSWPRRNRTTTEAPTTAAPTTVAPATAAPTTAKPTTTTAKPPTTTVKPPIVAAPTTAKPTTAAPTTAPAGGTASSGWRITIYYTAVESFHSGPTQNVTGCPNQACSRGDDNLGTYPASFVDAVHDEGTGRITSGPHAGRYLCWSVDVGYWLDVVPAAGYGQGLRPFVSAAADGGVLQRGARFRLADPLRQNDGSAIDAAFAALLKNTTWEVEDQFTPGLGGAGHLDIYIGEQNQANFTNSNRYVEMVNATIIRY